MLRDVLSKYLANEARGSDSDHGRFTTSALIASSCESCWCWKSHVATAAQSYSDVLEVTRATAGGNLSARVPFE